MFYTAPPATPHIPTLEDARTESRKDAMPALSSSEKYESGNTGVERSDGEGGEEVHRRGRRLARVDRIYVLNADLKSIRAAAQGGECCDGEGGEEDGEEEGGARVDRIYVLNADLKSIRAAAQGGECCDGEGGEEEGGAGVDRIYVLNTDLKSMRAAAQVVMAVMEREERR